MLFTIFQDFLPQVSFFLYFFSDVKTIIEIILIMRFTKFLRSDFTDTREC